MSTIYRLSANRGAWLSGAPAIQNGMIWNIVDRRARPYRWKRVNAIIEAVEYDNGCVDADEAPVAPPTEEICYDQREGISISEAVAWADAQRRPVTLYLYDDGKGTTIDGHFNGTESRL